MREQTRVSKLSFGSSTWPIRLSLSGRAPWLMVCGLGAGLAFSTSLPPGTAFIVLLAAAILLLSLRFAVASLVMYWILISFVSVTTLVSDFRLQVGTVPIGVPDLLAGLVAIALLIRVGRLRVEGRQKHLPAMTTAFGAFLIYGMLSAILGLVRGFPAYSVALDLRTIAYLSLGYWAARRLAPAAQHAALIGKLMILAVVGLAIQQFLVTARAVAAVGLNGQIIDHRDIGVPLFTGKYGILFSALSVHVARMRDWGWSVPTLALGMAAMAATFVRTGWLATAAGLVCLSAIVGWRSAPRIAAFAAVSVAAVVILTLSVPQAGAFEAAIQDRLIATFTPASTQTDTVAARITESQLALSNLGSPQEWFLGTGLGLSVSDEVHTVQHNSFVWFLSKEGLVGLAFLIVLIVLAPILISWNALKSRRHALWPLLAVLVGAHVANVVSGYASGQLSFWPYAPIVGMTIGWIENLAMNVRASGATQIVRPQGDQALVPVRNR